MRLLVAAERLGRGGGMERYLEIVLPALVARGATVHVLAREVEGTPPGVSAERVAWADEHDDPSDAARTATQRALAAFSPDVAVAHNVMDAGVVETLRGAPRLAYHLHDHRPFCPNGDRLYPRSARICTAPLGSACVRHALSDGCAYGPRPRTLVLIRRRERLRNAIAAADRVVVASTWMVARAMENRVAPERIVEIPPPLPDDAYAEAIAVPLRRAVVFAGRVVPQKGLDSLVRAIARVGADVRPELRAFGDGPALPDVRREAARLGVALNAAGTVPPGTVRAAMDEAMLVAIPSVWAEPFGYIGIEAFARGRAVIAYDVGGVTSWLEDGVSGWTVRRADEATLGRVIEGALSMDEWREDRQRNARSAAERYRSGPIVERLLSAYAG